MCLAFFGVFFSLFFPLSLSLSSEAAVTSRPCALPGQLRPERGLIGSGPMLVLVILFEVALFSCGHFVFCRPDGCCPQICALSGSLQKNRLGCHVLVLQTERGAGGKTRRKVAKHAANKSTSGVSQTMLIFAGLRHGCDEEGLLALVKGQR